MKRFSVGLIIGLVAGLILATTTFLYADQPIKLIVNGKEIQCDVPPQIINGRTLVPARALAEALGATVAWDEAQNAVVVTGGVQVGAKPGDLPGVTQPQQPTQKNVQVPEIKQEPILQQPGYYTGRQIFGALIKKYPNMKAAGGNPTIGPTEGEITFNGEKLWFGKQEFILPSIAIQDHPYLSIDPLIKAGILTDGDI